MHTFQVRRFFVDENGRICAILTFTCPDLEAAMHVLARVRGFLEATSGQSMAFLVVNDCHVPVDQHEVHTGLLARALARGPLACRAN
jgi:hypothetical protein